MPVPIYSDEWFHINDVLDGTKAKVLAQGLLFLYTYLRNLDPDARTKFEEKLNCVGDDLLVPTMEEIKRRHPRYWRTNGYWRPWRTAVRERTVIAGGQDGPSEVWRYFVRERTEIFLPRIRISSALHVG